MDTLSLIVGWIVLSFLAGIIGDSRECGFSKPLLLSFILSPLVGIIYAFSSTKKATLDFQKKMLEGQYPGQSEKSKKVDADPLAETPFGGKYTKTHIVFLFVALILIMLISKFI